MIKSLLVGTVTALFVTQTWACQQPEKDCLPPQVKAAPPTIAELKENIRNEHPIAFCTLAKAYLSRGLYDEFFLNFYVCQIRWRIYLQTAKDPKPSGEPEALGGMTWSLNQYIFAMGEDNRERWSSVILDAVEWHLQNPSTFQDLSLFKEDEQKMLDVLRKLSLDVLNTE